MSDYRECFNISDDRVQRYCIEPVREREPPPCPPEPTRPTKPPSKGFECRYQFGSYGSCLLCTAWGTCWRIARRCQPWDERCNCYGGIPVWEWVFVDAQYNPEEYAKYSGGMDPGLYAHVCTQKYYGDVYSAEFVASLSSIKGYAGETPSTDVATSTYDNTFFEAQICDEELLEKFNLPESVYISAVDLIWEYFRGGQIWRCTPGCNVSNHVALSFAFKPTKVVLGGAEFDEDSIKNTCYFIDVGLNSARKIQPTDQASRFEENPFVLNITLK